MLFLPKKKMYKSTFVDGGAYASLCSYCTLLHRDLNLTDAAVRNLRDQVRGIYTSIFLPYRIFSRFGVFRLDCSDGTVILPYAVRKPTIHIPQFFFFTSFLSRSYGKLIKLRQDGFEYIYNNIFGGTISIVNGNGL